MNDRDTEIKLKRAIFLINQAENILDNAYQSHCFQAGIDPDKNKNAFIK